MSEGIAFKAIFNKATTTIDKGWRISLDVSMDESVKVNQLAQLSDYVLQVAIIPITESDEMDFLNE